MSKIFRFSDFHKYVNDLDNIDENIKDGFYTADKFSILEDVLANNQEFFINLQQQKKNGELKFKPVVSEKDLESILEEIKPFVDNVFEKYDLKSPDIRYTKKRDLGRLSYLYDGLILYSFVNVGLNIFSNISEVMFYSLIAGILTVLLDNTVKDSGFYSYQDSLIMSTKKNYQNTLTTIAHEYAHHLCYETLPYKYIFSKIVGEGIGRQTERLIAGIFSEKDNNQSYYYDVLDKDYGESKSTYLWLAKKFGFSKQKSLLKTNSCVDSVEVSSRISNKRPTWHALGNSIYMINNINE